MKNEGTTQQGGGGAPPPPPPPPGGPAGGSGRGGGGGRRGGRARQPQDPRDVGHLLRQLSSKNLAGHPHSRTNLTKGKKSSLLYGDLSDLSLTSAVGAPHAALPSLYSVFEHDPDQIFAEKAREKAILRMVLPDGRHMPVDFHDALEAVGEGKFQLLLFLLNGLIYLCCSASMTTLSFILPATKCYLKIESYDKGIINSSSLLGMLAGTFVWGPMADSTGRRKTLLVCLAIDSVATVISSLSFNKYMLLIIRFFNGFGIIGPTSLVFAYLGEFILPKYKDTFLSSLEVFWCLGMAFIPAIAWLVIPLDVTLVMGPIQLESWNIFALCCAVPPAITFVLLLFFPESPHFLLHQGKLDKALKSLRIIHRVNKGRKEKFGIIVIQDRAILQKHFRQEQQVTGVCNYLKGILLCFAELFQKDLRIKTLQVCTVGFLLNYSYYTLVLWIPSLLENHDLYQEFYKESLTLCDASEGLQGNEKLNLKQKHLSLYETENCKPDIPDEVYVHTFIICLSCLPATIALFVLINYIGKKPLLFWIVAVKGMAALSLNFVKKASHIIIAFCCFEAMSTLCETLIFVIVVQLFPIHLSGTALALTVTCGRIAAIIGNTAFGALIDHYCVPPMYSFSIACFLSCAVTLTFPKMPTGHE